MTEKEYRATVAINASAITEGMKSMLHMRHVMYGGKSEDKRCFVKGRRMHIAVLEPERFESELTVWNGKQRRGKDWEACLDAAPEPDLIVTPDELAELNAISNVLWSRRDVSRLLDGCRFEQPVFWHDKRYGDGKCRADALNDTYVIDYKSCRDLSGFVRNAYKLLYHVRMGWYAHGIEAAMGVWPSVYLIAQESAPPYDCGLVHIPDSIVRDGAAEAIEVARRWAVHDRFKTYPGVMPEMVEFELPAWATNANAEVDMEGAAEL